MDEIYIYRVVKSPLHVGIASRNIKLKHQLSKSGHQKIQQNAIEIRQKSRQPT